ncbi:hypothetical protein ACWEIJ_34330 [Lentzea sp. NPDC004789]
MGNAGGLFHLSGGVVIAVDSPGSPGVETLLLTSGRISAESWAAALAESVQKRSLQEVLVARGNIGAAEAQVLAAAALRDGAFAVAVGDVERCVVDESADEPLLPVTDGLAPDVLLSQTGRRLDAVASLPIPLSPYRDRVVAASGAESADSTAERREIIAHATGRRSARDIAFAVGRGLYPVTVEVSRMLGEGVLEIASPAASFSFAHGSLASLHARAGAGSPPAGVERPG